LATTMWGTARGGVNSSRAKVSGPRLQRRSHRVPRWRYVRRGSSAPDRPRWPDAMQERGRQLPRPGPEFLPGPGRGRCSDVAASFPLPSPATQMMGKSRADRHN
jgi:hypothetical protein